MIKKEIVYVCYSTMHILYSLSCTFIIYFVVCIYAHGPDGLLHELSINRVLQYGTWVEKIVKSEF